MKTQLEILEHLKEIEEADYLGFQFEVLAQYLTPPQLAPLVKADDGNVERSWFKARTWRPAILEKRAVKAQMESYMEFAWGKALNHRGISASRSVEKFQAWLWLLGDARDVLTFAEDETNYAQYGAPILKRICEAYGFPIPEDERAWRMIRGEPCQPGCEEGCG